MMPCPTCLYYRTSCGPGCPTPRCPTCFRSPGDIHGPHCGDIMAAKRGDPTPATITRADCDSPDAWLTCAMSEFDAH